MAVWVVIGNLGSGKSLVAVSRIQKALFDGCRVATNMDLNLEFLVRGHKRRDVTRLPDWPTSKSLEALGRGYEGKKFDEKKFGLIVLDEVATFLNAREWAGSATATPEEKKQEASERMALIRWLRHARKHRWHLILITQDLESLDKQVRIALAEHVVTCARFDRFAVPIVSTLTKILGLGTVTMPQVHIGKVRYGTAPFAPLVDRWWTPDARLLFRCYDTQQKIMGECLGASMLDARHAPYMWPPSSVYDRLWAAGLWRWLPRSKARERYDDFRMYRDGVVGPYKLPPPSYGDWWAAKERVLLQDAQEVAEASDQSREAAAA